MSLRIDFVRTPPQKKKLQKRGGILKMENIGVFLKISLLAGLIFAVLSSVAYVDGRTKAMAKTRDGLSAEVKNIEREKDNVKLQIERAKGGNIQRQIARLKIGLRLPRWGQLRELEMPRTNQEKPGPAKLAQRSSGHGG